MPLRWEIPEAVGPTLGYDADGVEVARVVQRTGGWEAWYDRSGLERPPRAPFGPAPAGRRLGMWASILEAQAEVDRYHDRVNAQPPPDR